MHIPNRKSPEICPVCGTSVPRNSKACPDCGACHESGWNEISNIYDGLDLPDYAYDEDEENVVRTKFRQPRKPARTGIHPGWRVVAFILVALMFLGFWKWIAAQFSGWVG